MDISLKTFKIEKDTPRPKSIPTGWYGASFTGEHELIIIYNEIEYVALNKLLNKIATLFKVSNK